MTEPPTNQQTRLNARVLVLSMSFAPCKEVGGKRFAFLSKYLSCSFGTYHVIALRENSHNPDDPVFDGNVHRVRMYPHFSVGPKKGIHKVLSSFWKRWLCMIDPFVGWVIPAIVKGLRLQRVHRFNAVIVTGPSFSPFLSALVIAKLTGCRLIVDYRDPWTNHQRNFPRLFGKWLCPRIERKVIARSDAVVFCSHIMREQFIHAFGDVAPSRLEVIYNGFDDFELATEPVGHDRRRVRMLYAGRFYGSRQLSVIASSIAKLVKNREISPDTFQFDIYSHLSLSDVALVQKLRIEDLIQTHEPVGYAEIKKVMVQSDILFLPSGDEVAYAVPFKFFDYLSARQPILAVAPLDSTVTHLMHLVDCGEIAEFGNETSILNALRILVRGQRTYTFRNAEKFLWKNAATQYQALVGSIVSRVDNARTGR